MRSVSDGESQLVIDGASGAVCIASRLGRASGSACAPADATDIMVTYTMSVEGISIGVFDPTQRAVSVTVDGQDVAIRKAGDLVFFADSRTELPDILSVFDASGTELATFTPSADSAADLAEAEEPSH